MQKDTQFLSVYEEYEYHIQRIEEIFKNFKETESEVQSPRLYKLIQNSNFTKHKFFNIQPEKIDNLEIKTCREKDDVQVSTDNSTAPVKLIVNIPNKMLDYLKDTCKDNTDSISTNTKKKMNMTRKRRLMSLLINLFKKKKKKNSTSSSVSSLPVFNETSHEIFMPIFENVSNQEIKNADLIDSETVSIISSNSSLEKSIIFPVDCHVNDKIYVKIQPNLIIEHQVACSKNIQDNKLIKYDTDPCKSSLEMQIEGEIPLHHKKKVPEDSSHKITDKIVETTTTSCQKQSTLIDKKRLRDSEEKIKLKEFLLDLLIGALSANAKNTESKKCCCSFDLTNDICKRSESNKDISALDVLLQHIVTDTTNNIDESTKGNMQNLPKRESSKVSICTSNESLSTIGDAVDTKSIKYFPVLQRSHKKNYIKTEKEDYYNSVDSMSYYSNSKFWSGRSASIERKRNQAVPNPGKKIAKGTSKSLERTNTFMQ